MSVLAIQSTSNSRSRSSSRRSLGKKISALGARLTRTLSHPEENREEEERYSLVSDEPPSYYNDERSRDAFQSTGRGGLGNIRQASLSRAGRPDGGPDDFSPTRGREVLADHAPTTIFSTGRGGAGNLRSPSRDSALARDPVEQDVIRKYIVAHEDAPVSSGRGGIGNISRGSPRSRSRPPAAYTTGRGGASIIIPGDTHRAEQIDQETRGPMVPHSGPYSAGRDSHANTTTLPQPPTEHRKLTEHESTGGGGLRNINARSNCNSLS
ncbi:hypothetical protein HYPSUDRAFT_58156 [Hypholoma sublateritium FD-334 SS-4]|uniref:Uncharacterized protein n=1 Tax=Hypholoma sublateritium (strain FD-334 SS-4) TaxID=945553 RepID=A0A0D2NBJ9_HYPSF|nr:hypothetical protein HYPSUDRAFT_58156 [Hypholoma sublateritium FD-334 SS-4]